MTFRIMPSDPEYEIFEFLSYYIAALKNHHMFWDLQGMSETERRTELSVVMNLFEELTH